MSRNTIGLKRGGGPGRPKGVPNRATLDAREFCAGIVCDPAYQDALRRRALAGKLAPAIECLLWHYAHGKPNQHVEQTGTVTLKWQTDELTERLLEGRKRAALADGELP